ncbi:MAG: DUF4340 domain-containing protein [Thermosynechococcaceae cyanobacterium MS004]|nr:DUF4340 domain-containing protein [Thermosynechococcaceae cyanobacterium MS004]
MKLKLQTILLLAIALLSVGGLYLWDKNRNTESAIDNPTGTALFQDIQESDITQITIEQAKPDAQKTALTLVRQASGWQITKPKTAAADEATVAFLLNLLATGRSERSLSAKATELQQFGLDSPVTTVTFQLKNNQTHQIRLGGQTFDQALIYAIVDPPSSGAEAAGEVPIALLPTSFLNATNRPLTDWQVKPKATPSGTPSDTPSSGDTLPGSSPPINTPSINTPSPADTPSAPPPASSP